MPAKAPKLTQLEREIRATKKQQLSSVGRCSRKNVRDGSFRGSINLNRSTRWQTAFSYQEARDASPSDRPVR